MRQDTLVFLLNDETQEILLAMKKRGFGVGKLNGVCGKVQAKAFVRIQEKDLVKVAELVFHFKDKPEWSINCHVFFARAWEGEPKESEEMEPEWFDISNLPFDRMWVDDKYWLPMVLRGDYVQAELNFNNNGSELLLYKINGSKN